MQTHAFIFPPTALPLLDEEFDKADSDNVPAMTDHLSSSHLVLCHDRAWEDQLDAGDEVTF